MNAVPQVPSQAGEVLAVIAEALTRKPENLALEHFPGLRARTRRLHKDFLSAIESANALIADWRRSLEEDAAVVDAFKRADSDQEPFRRIAPILAENFQRVARALARTTEPAKPARTIEELDAVVAKFEDFIGLGSAVRQFMDSLVEISYQLVALDAAKFNFKFLDSVASFAPVAPPSLHQTLYSEGLQAIVTRFAAMTGKQRRNSEFSQNEHAQFSDRVTWLKGRLGSTERLEASLKLLQVLL